MNKKIKAGKPYVVKAEVKPIAVVVREQKYFLAYGRKCRPGGMPCNDVEWAYAVEGEIVMEDPSL